MPKAQLACRVRVSAAIRGSALLCVPHFRCPLLTTSTPAPPRGCTLRTLSRSAHLSEAKATMIETQTMMKRLTTMHKEHIEKQSLFDNGMEQEHAIEIATSQITQSFHRCQKLIQAISRKSGMSASQADQRLGKSAASAAARDLQDLSMMFRKSQASYLKRKFTVCGGFRFSPHFFFLLFLLPFSLPG